MIKKTCCLACIEPYFKQGRINNFITTHLLTISLQFRHTFKQGTLQFSPVNLGIGQPPNRKK